MRPDGYYVNWVGSSSQAQSGNLSGVTVGVTHIGLNSSSGVNWSGGSMGSNAQSGGGSNGGSSLNTWDYISNGAGVASTYPTIASTWSYNSSGGDIRWAGKNGNYYVKSQVKMNGGYAKSIKYAQNASRNLSRIGNGLTILSVGKSVISAGIAVNNGTDNTSTWVGLGIGVGGAILTVVGSPVIVTGAAICGAIWGINQLFYGDEINGSIDSNFGYR